MNNSFPIEVQWLGGRCLELKIALPLEPSLFRSLASAAAEIRSNGIADGAVSSYGSLAAYWIDAPVDRQHVAEKIEHLARQMLSDNTGEVVAQSEHYIGVTYTGGDLEAVASHNGIDVAEVIVRHQAADYTVAAVGFMPHFAYLWGMDASIATPRRDSPRTRVPAGALGIAGDQTGIYPQQSPGGWQLIGQVDPAISDQICPQLQVGDTVRFEATK